MVELFDNASFTLNMSECKYYLFTLALTELRNDTSIEKCAFVYAFVPCKQTLRTWDNDLLFGCLHLICPDSD